MAKFFRRLRRCCSLSVAVGGTDLALRIDQPIAQALVVPLVVIVLQKLVDRVPQRSPPEENHAIQAGFLDRGHKPLGVRVGLRRQMHPMAPNRRNFFRSRIPSIY